MGGKNNQSPSHADVTIVLFGYWRYVPAVNCTWIQLDYDSKSVRADNKGGVRLNAREWYATDTWTLYMNVVDVNIPGELDLPDTFDVTRDVECRPIE